MLLKFVLCGWRHIRGSLLHAKLARFGDQILLAQGTGLQLGDDGIGLPRVFAGGVGKNKIHSGHCGRDDEDGSESNLEPAVERKRVLGHLLRDSQGLECGVRELLPFHCDLCFVAPFFFGAEHSQLRAHASLQFCGIPGTRDGVIGAKIQGCSALFRRRADQQNHANDGGGRGTPNRGKRVASGSCILMGSAGTGQPGLHQEQIGARLMNGIESFTSAGESGHIVPGGLQRRTQILPRGCIAFDDYNFFACVIHGSGRAATKIARVAPIVDENRKSAK